jgi:hypothetical protein
MMNGQAKLHFGDDWNRVKFYMEMMIQTFSGELFTSFKNTLVIAILLFGFIITYFEETEEKDVTMEDFVAKFGKHSGFTLEGECYIGEEECKAIDFLKGWWVPTGGSYEFMPLPSRILTYGKTRTNFVHTTPGKKNPERSARYAAYATARCNAVVPRNYPILGSYLAMCDRVSISWDIGKKIKLFDPLYTEPGMGPLFGSESEGSIKIPTDVVLDMMRVRYGEELADNIIQLDDFLNDIDFDTFEGFTVTAGFPWLSILRDVDYGRPKEVASLEHTIAQAMRAFEEDSSSDKEPLIREPSPFAAGVFFNSESEDEVSFSD